MLEPISKKKLVWASPDIKLEEISTLKNMTTLKSSCRPVNVTTNTFSMYFAIIELELVVPTGTVLILLLSGVFFLGTNKY